MKKFIVLLVIAAIIVAIAAPFVIEYTSTASKDGTPVTITINEGASAKEIASILKANKLIRSKQVFLLRLKNSEYDGLLKFGTYELHTGMCVIDIIKKLATDSDKNYITLTIPEGFTVQMIAKRAEEVDICTEDEFLKALEDDYDYSFIDNIPDTGADYKLQGFLYPNTYFFYKSSTAHDVIDTMLSEFERQFVLVEGVQNSKYPFYDTITIASMIERESKLEIEKSKISGVIYNRLDKGMKLQIDATVVYAISDGLYDVEKVYYNDLETDSGYNTYKYEGIPAGPICNPSISSIEAAYHPDSHNYLYYHTDETQKNGSHIFTETFDEHTNTMG